MQRKVSEWHPVSHSFTSTRSCSTVLHSSSHTAPGIFSSGILSAHFPIRKFLFLHISPWCTYMATFQRNVSCQCDQTRGRSLQDAHLKGRQLQSRLSSAAGISVLKGCEVAQSLSNQIHFYSKHLFYFTFKICISKRNIWSTHTDILSLTVTTERGLCFFVWHLRNIFLMYVGYIFVFVLFCR